jgi:hypothetical protein
MPLFGGKRDVSLLNSINRELIIDIVDTEVAVYKMILDESQTNLYREAENKVYMQPVKIPCLINRSDSIFDIDSVAIALDYNQSIQFYFLQDILMQLNLPVEVGDVIEYNGEYYETDSISENQFFVGKNERYSFAGRDWGTSVSIIANAHLTRRSRLNIEETYVGVNKQTTGFKI